MFTPLNASVFLFNWAFALLFNRGLINNVFKSTLLMCANLRLPRRSGRSYWGNLRIILFVIWDLWFVICDLYQPFNHLTNLPLNHLTNAEDTGNHSLLCNICVINFHAISESLRPGLGRMHYPPGHHHSRDILFARNELELALEMDQHPLRQTNPLSSPALFSIYYFLFTSLHQHLVLHSTI